MIKLKTFYLTDAGKVRSHNEDSVTILKNQNNEYLMMVADGMGGHRKGEIASMLAISSLGKRFSACASIGTKIDAINWLNDNVNEINKLIIEYTLEHEDSSGMGTTLVAAILTKEFLIIGNIGDSSGYVMKNNKLHKITKDHTLVNLLVQAGDLTEDEAMSHPQKNVLMRALGANDKAEIDIFDVMDEDISGIMLCSDGLTTMLSNELIEKILQEDIDVEEKVKKLVNRCNIRGGNDNISIALLEKEEKGDTK